jgi:hypothetical protein
LFTDHGKAFDSIQRQILFDILKSRNIPDTLLKATVDIQTQNKISKLVEINKSTPRLPSLLYTV